MNAIIRSTKRVKDSNIYLSFLKSGVCQNELDQVFKVEIATIAQTAKNITIQPRVKNPPKPHKKTRTRSLYVIGTLVSIETA